MKGLKTSICGVRVMEKSGEVAGTLDCEFVIGTAGWELISLVLDVD
jgi:hypothetical protein